MMHSCLIWVPSRHIDLASVGCSAQDCDSKRLYRDLSTMIKASSSRDATQENWHCCNATKKRENGEIYDFARYFKDFDNDSYLGEDFNKSPVLDIRFLVCRKYEDLSAEGANSDETSIWAPSEALDTRKDTIGGGRGFSLLVKHWHTCTRRYAT